MSPKKKLLFIISGLGVGGAETALYTLLKNLKGIFEIEVIALTQGGVLAEKIDALGIPTHILNFKKIPSLLQTVRHFHKVTKNFQPDIIQGWMYHGNLFAHLARLFSPKSKVFLCIRQSLEDLKGEKKLTKAIITLDAKLSKQADKIIYNSYAGQRDHEGYGYAQGKGIVLPNGFDTHRFHPQKDAHQTLCASLHIDPQSLLIGIIGRSHPVKDHATFIQAAELLSHPNAHFILIGEGVNRLEIPPSLQTKMHLLDLREDIPFLTAALDILTSCSLSEGLPNTLCEAMACGILCIATDVGDSKRIMGDTGILIPVRSPQALAQGWETLLALPAQERNKRSQKARKKICQEYSIQKLITTYQAIVENA